MSNQKTTCIEQQEALLEAYLSQEEGAGLPMELDQHLARCADCRRYWNSVCAVRSGFQTGPLYSSALREKTLSRLFGTKQNIPGLEWLPLVMLASVLSLFLSFVLPGWLLSKLFLHWTSSTVAAYELAYGTLLVLGILVTMAAAVPLIGWNDTHSANDWGGDYLAAEGHELI